MSDKKVKVKKKSIEEIEKDIYCDEISLVRNLFRWLNQKNPEKARKVLDELRAETV